ncbi:hypothetical protein HDU86_004741 [Geranomyces michiganensis]|nr:hypothetical protein HDU86_004741 [Geranomyces michiganensis]
MFMEDSDTGNDGVNGGRVRFGDANDTEVAGAKTKPQAEPQSILKANAVMSPVDFAALTSQFSDSGSEGMSSFEDDSEHDSLSNSGSGTESQSNSESDEQEEEEDMDSPYRKKKRKQQYLYGLANEEEEAELDSEIDFPDDPAEELPGAAAPPLSGRLDETDSGRLETATIADYEDIDGLMVTLDAYLKKNRNSRALQPAAMRAAPLLAALKHIKTKDPPTWAQEASAALEVDAGPTKTEVPASPVSSGLLGNMLQKFKDLTEPKLDSTDCEALGADDKVNMIMAKLTEANVKKITTRIYIEDAKSFKTLLLTSLMSSDQVIEEVVTKFHQEVSPNWTLFELCNDLGVERPLRDWEIVTDVISAWEASASVNAIVMKKYGYRDTVSEKSIAGKYPRVQGWMYMELKPGKWQRRFFVLRDSNLYYYKDAKQTGVETLFCGLSNFDVYTLSQRRKKTPSPFTFALRSTDSISMFENKQDYVRFLSVDKEERLFDWVLAIRLAKSEKTFADFPELFDDYNIPEKVRKRRQRPHAAGGSGKKPSGTLIDQSELKAPPSLPINTATELRRENTRLITSQPRASGPMSPPLHQQKPLSRRPSQRAAPAIPRPPLIRRATGSPPPSGSDDDEEPLLVRQMRHTSGAIAGDDESRAPRGPDRDDARLDRRPSRSEAERGDTSQSDRDDTARRQHRRKPRSTRHPDDEHPNIYGDRDSDPLALRAHGAVRPSRSLATGDLDPRRAHTMHTSSSRIESRHHRYEHPSDEQRERRAHRESRDHGDRDYEHRVRTRRRDPEREAHHREREAHREHRRERERVRAAEGGERQLRDTDPLGIAITPDASTTTRRHRSAATRSKSESKPLGTLVDRIGDAGGGASTAARPLQRARTTRENNGAKRSGGTLIDVSDSPNCRRCGCSEFKPGARGSNCLNCYHAHMES